MMMRRLWLTCVMDVSVEQGLDRRSRLEAIVDNFVISQDSDGHSQTGGIAY